MSTVIETGFSLGPDVICPTGSGESASPRGLPAVQTPHECMVQMIYPSSITLGTAALGMSYGIANADNVPTLESVDSIFDFALKNGITCFDTAPGYGIAESRIGNWVRSRKAAPLVITKLPSLAAIADHRVYGAIDTAILKSASALSMKHIGGYLTHDAADYQTSSVRDALDKAVSNDLISAYGPSVYTSEEVQQAISCAPPNIIQLPLNLIDHRMIKSGALRACNEADVIVFARSIFLQGLLLMEADEIPSGLKPISGCVKACRDLAADLGVSLASLALRFVRDLPGIASVVIGVHSLDQLDEVLSAADEPPLTKSVLDEIDRIAAEAPEELLDPRTWPA